mmetsp:Transcript_11382/g.13573  ORF Transcript_11382/g.13573 Transcript_11382/m.13573 type:complete len:292 (-) Transcript_11382:280-1155(-)|eukprot:jgi/Bigna1/92020/estExt_fgenesh1_pg.C_1740004
MFSQFDNERFSEVNDGDMGLGGKAMLGKPHFHFNPHSNKRNHKSCNASVDVSNDLKTRPHFISSPKEAPTAMSSGLSIPGLGLRSVFTGPPTIVPRATSAPVQPVYRSLSGVVPSGGIIYRSAPTLSPKVTPRPLPAFFEKNTSFSSSRPATHIFRALESSLQKYSIVMKPEKAKIKGEAQIMGQPVKFHVHVFQKKDGNHLIEFQRRSGDSCGFWYLFRDVMQGLSTDLADAAAFVKNNGCDSRYSLYKNFWEKSSAPNSISTSTDSSTVADFLSKRLAASLITENESEW